MSLKSAQIFLETHRLNFIKFLFPVLIWFPQDLVSPFLFPFWGFSFILLVSPPTVLILGYPWVSGLIRYWWLHHLSSAQVNPLAMNKDNNCYNPRCVKRAGTCGLASFLMARQELAFLVQRLLFDDTWGTALIISLAPIFILELLKLYHPFHLRFSSSHKK